MTREDIARRLCERAGNDPDILASRCIQEFRASPLGDVRIQGEPQQWQPMWRFWLSEVDAMIELGVLSVSDPK